MTYGTLTELNRSKTGGTYQRGFNYVQFIQNNIFWILSIFLLSCLFIGHVQASQDKNIQNNISKDMAMVYNVCNESRQSATISEQKCGELQDQTHTEFLCNENNTFASTHCWVEYKGVNYDN